MPTWKTTLRSTHNYFARFWTDAPTQCLAPATCYKVIRADLLNSIPIRSDRFGFEPEIVMKSAERTLRIYEVPIRYHGRAYEKGKTISWKVGIKALATSLGVILKYWLFGDFYGAPYGRCVLNDFARNALDIWVG